MNEIKHEKLLLLAICRGWRIMCTMGNLGRSIPNYRWSSDQLSAKRQPYTCIGKMSADRSTNFRPLLDHSIGQLSADMSTDAPSKVGQVLVKYRQAIGWVLVECQLNIGQSSTEYRSTLDRHIARHIDQHINQGIDQDRIVVHMIWVDYMRSNVRYVQKCKQWRKWRILRNLEIQIGQQGGLAWAFAKI